MATTRIIAMHAKQGSTIAQCLTDRKDYAIDSGKTEDGKYISAYACDPHTADAEFLFSKRQYEQLTGRTQYSNVIAYQVRQSFKPGEITPEEANQVGYEFASRFLKGQHAFIVATHTDRAHIHNYIMWNSTSLDCRKKFRDFLGSGRAVARLSDMICLEHRLSVVEKPQRRKSYNKWLGDRAKPSNREQLRLAIDDALRQKPESIEALLELLEGEGYTIRRGAHLTFSHPEQKQNIRLRSLGENYSEDALRAVIAGTKHHVPRKKHSYTKPQKASLLINVQAKLVEGKGGGYRQWASVFNLKQMAKTVLYLQEHDLADYEDLASKVADASGRCDALTAKIRAAEQRMVEINTLKTHIINYAHTREIFAAYKKSGYSKRFLAEHEEEIRLHRAAKKAFNEAGLQKLPTVKSLQTEFAQLLREKKSLYAELHQIRKDRDELAIHKANVEQILGIQRTEPVKKKEQERQ